MRRIFSFVLAGIIIGSLSALPEATEATRPKVYCPLIVYRCPDGSFASPKPPSCNARCRKVRRPVYPYPWDAPAYLRYDFR